MLDYKPATATMGRTFAKPMGQSTPAAALVPPPGPDPLFTLTG